MKIESLRKVHGSKCCYCGILMDFDHPRDKLNSATIEHTKDAALGGKRVNTKASLALACLHCNRAKNHFFNTALQGWKMFLQAKTGQE